MKLLVLTSYYPPEVNAASVRLFQIVNKFYKKNKNIKIKVAVFNPLYKEIRDTIDENAGIEVHRYRRKVLPSFIFMPQSLNPITLISWVRIARKEITKFHPDLVLTSSPPFAAAISVYIVLKIFKINIPYVVDYRDDLTGIINGIAESRRIYFRIALKAANNLMSSLFFRSLKNASLISTVNEVLQKRLLEVNENVTLVPNGFDVQELEEITHRFKREDVLKKIGILDDNSRIIVYLGDLDVPYNMPEVLLKSLKKVNDLGYRLIYVIIGNGKRKDLIEKMAEDMKLQDSVYLLGGREHRDAIEILLASDLAFYCSQKAYPQAKHAIGTKVYEYVGCKLPILVVADEGSAISDFVEKNGIGEFVGWNSLDGMEHALKMLLESQKYKDNIEMEYQDFINKFDRDKGIDFLYKEVKDLFEN